MPGYPLLNCNCNYTLDFSSHTAAQRVAVVNFAARGVSGYIRFTEEGQDVRIEANLQGLVGKW